MTIFDIARYVTDDRIPISDMPPLETEQSGLVWNDSVKKTSHIVTHAVTTNFDREVSRHDTHLEADLEAQDLQWKATNSDVIGRTYDTATVTLCGILTNYAAHAPLEYDLCPVCVTS